MVVRVLKSRCEGRVGRNRCYIGPPLNDKMGRLIYTEIVQTGEPIITKICVRCFEKLFSPKSEYRRGNIAYTKLPFKKERWN